MSHNKRINAYTLMEVTIAMLLSAICITICYTAYGLINDYYIGFRDRNESSDIVLSLGHVIERDCLTARYITRTNDGFELSFDSAKISYHLNEIAILRTLNSGHVDTFKVASSGLSTTFEGNEVLVPDTLDTLHFRVLINDGVKIPMQFRKVYSAQDLLR